MKPLAGVAGSLAAGSLAAVLVGCGTGTGTGSSTSLPPLQLTDASTAARGLMAPAPAGAVGGTGSPFVLHTTLPTGTPAPAPVWRLPHADASDAATVASALGIGSRPSAVAGGWVIRYAGQRLAVRSDGTWWWGMDCSPDVPVEKESLDVMCASASGGGVAVAPPAGTTNAGGASSRPVPPPTPPPPPDGPTAADARALATQVLGALGWTDASVDVAVGAPTTTVTARRDINGVETADWLTTLTYRADLTRGATLVDANGWIGDPSRGRSYPLIDAARAFQMLAAEPRMMPEICQVRKDGKPGCEPIPPTVITGAALGLALRHDLERPLLVPAWLFTVKGSTTPLAVVAVDPRWIAPPTVTVPKPLPPQSVNPAPASVDPAGPAVKPT